LGDLRSRGWMPARTIVYCAWDGEEPGLLGSVEWVETHLAELQKHAVAYVNSDTNERGYMLPEGTQDLESFISGVARAVTDPETQMTVYQRSHLYSLSKAKNAEERAAVRKRNDLEVTALGDGSDYTAFQDYAGISTLSIEFGDEDDGTQYHSIYDDFYWYTHFVDTDFAYGGRCRRPRARRSCARGCGFDSGRLFAAGGGRGEIRGGARKAPEGEAGRIQGARSRAARGRVQGDQRPASPDDRPAAGDDSAVHQLRPHEKRDRALEEKCGALFPALAAYEAAGSPDLPRESLALINADFERVSRLFLNQKGLPERPWFKNQVYAPGAYTGYGAKPIAAVREYMDEKRWREAEGQVPQVAQVIENVAAGIDKASSDFEGALRLRDGAASR
jgi:N-acetylated-alpha-linked acidic dipeptidase